LDEAKKKPGSIRKTSGKEQLHVEIKKKEGWSRKTGPYRTLGEDWVKGEKKGTW